MECPNHLQLQCDSPLTTALVTFVFAWTALPPVATLSAAFAAPSLAGVIARF